MVINSLTDGKVSPTVHSRIPGERKVAYLKISPRIFPIEILSSLEYYKVHGVDM